MMRKLKFKIIDCCMWIIEKLMSNEIEVLPVHVVVLDDDAYIEYMEFRDNIFMVYENEEELKEDFPNAQPVTKH